MAKRDDVTPDTVAGVPDSGIAHAVGYANESGMPSLYDTVVGSESEYVTNAIDNFVLSDASVCCSDVDAEVSLLPEPQADSEITVIIAITSAITL